MSCNLGRKATPAANLGAPGQEMSMKLGTDAMWRPGRRWHNDQEVFIELQNQRNDDSVSFNVNDVIGTCIFHDQY